MNETPGPHGLQAQQDTHDSQDPHDSHDSQATPGQPGSTATGRPLRVVLVEDSLTIRRQLIPWLESRATLRIVGEASDEAMALALVDHTAPDAVLLDLSLAQGGSGITVLKALRKRGYRGQVHVLSHQTPDTYRAACLSAGADGFFDKAEELEALWLHLFGAERARAPLAPLRAAALLDRLDQTARLAMRDGGELAVHVVLGDSATLAEVAASLADALDLGDVIGWLDEPPAGRLAIVLGEPDTEPPLIHRLAQPMADAALRLGHAAMPAEALSAGGLLTLAQTRAMGLTPR
ncbi:response regulator [Roseateles amylovorans]|uniref:Response regulator transcription factor n=1 Tax=Roseateles amylovorans TaxID=2978473 RepID=A0ABY6AVZ8_9BURK|nr:response regulator transcription factor [Roseateles amylovorans]UXH77354.1 response regulator transcription factor [Roseateles amylovorans]